MALHGDGARDGLAQQAPPRKGDSKEGKGSLELSSSRHQLVSHCCDDAVQAVSCPASAGGTAGGPGAAWSWRSASSLHVSGVAMPGPAFLLPSCTHLALYWSCSDRATRLFSLPASKPSDQQGAGHVCLCLASRPAAAAACHLSGLPCQHRAIQRELFCIGLGLSLCLA